MKQSKVDTNKSLEQLDGENWGERTYDSHLVSTCHELRQVPLSQLKPENFRILIGQNMSLKYLMPRALDLLEPDPWIECDFYPGDLLNAVLKANTKYWIENPDQRERLLSIAKKAREMDGKNWKKIEEAFTKFTES